MLKKIFQCLCIFVLIIAVSGCGKPKEDKPAKIAASFGVGSATRWGKEKAYMEERAKELGVDMTVALNTTGDADKQIAECKQLIDSGISVLILMPRNTVKLQEVLDYAQQKNVKVICYARPIPSKKVNLFVGYDNKQIGRAAGLYAIELTREGNFIILRGDKFDNNAVEIYAGVMSQIQPVIDSGSINVILDEFVPSWSPVKAKQMVKEALIKNNKQISAIIAPNDKIAGAAVEALKELNIDNKVVITGMDAELAAVRRIVAGQQSMTIHLDIKESASTAVDAANELGSKNVLTKNADLSFADGLIIPAYLISGKVVNKQNIDRQLINTGTYTKEQIYN